MILTLQLAKALRIVYAKNADGIRYRLIKNRTLTIKKYHQAQPFEPHIERTWCHSLLPNIFYLRYHIMREALGNVQRSRGTHFILKCQEVVESWHCERYKSNSLYTVNTKAKYCNINILVARN